MQSLAVTLREGVEAALIIAIVLSYLRKTNKSNLNRLVYTATGAALVASVLGALFFVRLNPNPDRIEGWTELAAAILIAGMLIWMQRKGKTLKRDIEGRLEAVTQNDASAAAFGVFSFVFLTVLREGIETVLFLGAASLTTTSVLNVIGGLLGIVLAFLFGMAFVKGSIKVNLKKFFAITTAILFLFAIKLFIAGLHDLSEAKILPSSKTEMAIIGPIVTNEAFFLIVILGLVLTMLLSDPAASPEPKGSGHSKAESRKAAYLKKKESSWRRVASMAAFGIIVFISAAYVYSRGAGALSSPTPVSASDGYVQIPVAKIDDGFLHRFVFDYEGVAIRFIVVKAGDHRIGTAFDACEICGNSGYYQSKNNVICRTCGAAIYVPSIGKGGGCNPIALQCQLSDTFVIIPVGELIKAKKLFQP